MGYYSTMHYCNFKSNLQLKELQERLSMPQTTFMDKMVVLSEEYDVKEELESGSFEIFPESGDYYGKHYKDVELAKYLAEVIAPGEYTTLEFDGEDGDRWGLLIFPNEVKPIVYVGTVDGILINDYLDRMKLRGER